MCLVPVDSDAPMYHYPLMTVGLIATNIVTFVATDWGFGPLARDWILAFGPSYEPVQWLMYNFVHLGPVHLVANMIFLWAFGMIIEGKIGWWKFLLLYLGVGICGGIFMQWWMQNSVGPPFGIGGASVAVFALMGICLIWSPLNDLQCVMVWWNRTIEFDVPVVWFSGLCIVKELFVSGVGQFQMGSAFAHTVGAVIGLGVGVTMLKHKLVECEEWDVFSVSKGRHQKSYFARYRRSESDVAETSADSVDQQRNAPEELRAAFESEDWLTAWKIYGSNSNRSRRSLVSSGELCRIANGLYRRHLYVQAADAYYAVLEQPTEAKPEVRLKLAAILTEIQQRPKAALRVLRPLRNNHLPARLSQKMRQIKRLATRMVDEGCMEIAGR
jgi:membrane associated rhomboid family serine protease